MLKIASLFAFFIFLILFPDVADAGRREWARDLSKSGYAWVLGILGLLVVIWYAFFAIDWKVRLKNGQIALLEEVPNDQIRGIPSFDSDENTELTRHKKGFFDIGLNKNRPIGIEIVGRGMPLICIFGIMLFGGLSLFLIFSCL